jgi:hypothetical protein
MTLNLVSNVRESLPSLARIEEWTTEVNAKRRDIE